MKCLAQPGYSTECLNLYHEAGIMWNICAYDYLWDVSTAANISFVIRKLQGVFLLFQPKNAS